LIEVEALEAPQKLEKERDGTFQIGFAASFSGKKQFFGALDFSEKGIS
jgi:hypothetical protein